MYITENISNEELIHVKTISVSGKYCSQIIAKYTVMSMDDFNRFNPYFDKVMASSNNTYDLKLPGDKADLFAANKYQILNESVQILLSGGLADSSSANPTVASAMTGTVPAAQVSAKAEK